MTTLLTALLLTLTAGAQDRSSGPPPPPPEATEACASLAEGDACSFEGRHDDTVEGTCTLTPKEELACAPEGGPPGGRPPRGGPPDGE